MTKTPRVSICIPTYNGREHLAECLASVRAQTFTGFEVLICDDESSDGTLELARQLAGDDPRFRFIPNPRNLGLVGNWNNCLDQARGEWIKFVFQDDLIEPRCVERLVTAAEQRGARFSFCQRRMIFDPDTARDLREYLDWHVGFVAKIFGPVDAFVDAPAFTRITVQNMHPNLLGEPTVTLFHRSLASELGKFTPAMIQACDSEYWIRLGTNVGVVYVAETLAAFRVHGRSATSRNLAEKDYRVRLLDPLVFNYLYLHDPVFANLRRELYRTPGRIAIRWQLACLAYDARHLAYTGRDGRTFEKEWTAITAIYPALKRLAFFGRFCRLVRSVLILLHLKRR